MEDKGMLYIITNNECFVRAVGSNHLTAIQQYYKEKNLDYSFSLQDHQKAPCMLAEEGNIVIKTDENNLIAIFYLPEVVTENQCNWFFKNKDEFKKYRFVGALLIEKNKEPYDTLHGLDEIDQMMYQKMKNEDNSKHL